jgi:hypothetical protein
MGIIHLFVIQCAGVDGINFFLRTVDYKLRVRVFPKGPTGEVPRRLRNPQDFREGGYWVVFLKLFGICL